LIGSSASGFSRLISGGRSVISTCRGTASGQSKEERQYAHFQYGLIHCPRFLCWEKLQAHYFPNSPTLQ
jgi:hypothetical protein